MALFFKKNSVPAGAIGTEDEILGYLDEIMGSRSEITVKCGKDTAVCRPYSLNDEKKFLIIEKVGRIMGFNGKTVECGFALERIYFSFKTNLVVVDNKPALKYPPYIEVYERRKDARTALISRESPQVSMLEQLGGGLGVSGELSNISADGAAVTVSRVVDIKSEKELPTSRANFSPGHKFMLVRIKSFGGVGSFDASAEVVWCSYGGIGIKFTSIPSSSKKAIKRFVESRKLDESPTKRSRKKRLEMQKMREQEASMAVETRASGPEEEPAVQEAVKEIGEEEKSTVVTKVPKPAIIISLGKELADSLTFIRHIPEYKWISCETPIELSAYLKKGIKNSVLLVQHNINGKNMLLLLKKLYSMDILNIDKILFFSSTGIQREDIAVCKLVGIKDILELPVRNIDKVRELLP